MAERDDGPAERIARAERDMNAVMSAMAHQLSEGLPALPPDLAMPARRRRVWRRWTVGPLAAAAVVAALILLPNGAIEEVGVPRASPARSMVSEMDVEAERPFVVFPTNDPDIAVVWLLNPEESD